MNTSSPVLKVTDAELKQLFNSLSSRAGRYYANRLTRKLFVLAVLVVAVGYGLLRLGA